MKAYLHKHFELKNSLLADALASKQTSAAEVQQSTKVVDFTKEDLDKFGITDLRSTDFIEAGGSYFKPLAASTAEILANPALPTTTQEIWSRIGLTGNITDLRINADTKWGQYTGGTQVVKGQPLFPRLTA